MARWYKQVLTLHIGELDHAVYHVEEINEIEIILVQLPVNYRYGNSKLLTS